MSAKPKTKKSNYNTSECLDTNSEKKENLYKKCPFCFKQAEYSTEWVIRSPCCDSFIHVQCMEGTVFLPSKREVYCPICTKPKKEKENSLVRKAKEKVTDRNNKPTDAKFQWDALYSYITKNQKTLENKTSAKNVFESLRKTCKQTKDKKKVSKMWTNFFMSQDQIIRYEMLKSMGWSIYDLSRELKLCWSDLLKLGF